MGRMKTFLMYLLIIVVFFIFSKVLEDGLIKQMYSDMSGTVDNSITYASQDLELNITVTEAKITRRNGYINLTVENDTSTYISEAYVKVDLYSQSGIHAITKYMEISGLSQGESKTYRLRFSGSYINRYEISLSNDYPNKHYIINIFGYDINTSDVFGYDISEYVNADTYKSFGHLVYDSAVYTVQNIPWWAWLWAWCIVVGVW